MKTLLIPLILLNSFTLFAQKHMLETGLGLKYDVFRVEQSSEVFEVNFDAGASAYIAYGRPLTDNLNWQVGLHTNNYKLNFKVKGSDNLIYAPRELVSAMRSNRLSFQLEHQKQLKNERLSWVNQAGFSLLIGTKNPYDVVLQRSKQVETPNGTEQILIRISTFGKTGSSILLGASTRLHYQLKKDIQCIVQAGFLSGTGELTRVDVDYVVNASPAFKKARFTNRGLAPILMFGVRYLWLKEVK